MDETNEIQMTNYNITAHASERYAERMAGQDDVTSIRQYINAHGSSIKERINKLITYGEMIYKGNIREYRNNTVYYNNQWVILVDQRANNVITLYKIDLGDDEVSKLYCQKYLENIKYKQDIANALAETKKAANEEHKNTIDENDAEIEILKRKIKFLEEANDIQNSLIKANNEEVNIANIEVKTLVESFIGRRKF